MSGMLAVILSTTIVLYLYNISLLVKCYRKKHNIVIAAGIGLPIVVMFVLTTFHLFVLNVEGFPLFIHWLAAPLQLLLASTLVWGTRVTIGKVCLSLEEMIDNQFLQDVLDAIPNPVFYKDADGTYRGCNTAFERAMGVARSEIINKSVGEIYADERAELYRQKDDELTKTGGEQVYEMRLKYADGTNHYVVVHKALYTKSDGVTQGIVGAMLDVTRARHAAEMAQDSYDLLDNIIETLPHPIFVKDDQHRMIMVNSAACEFSGLKREHWIGRTDDELFTPELARQHYESENEALATNKVMASEEVLTDLNGVSHNIMTRKRAFTRANGSRIIVGILVDITEHKKAVEELRLSTEVWQNTFDSIAEAITVHDREGHILRANRAAVQFAGLQLDNMLGTTCNNAFQCGLSQETCHLRHCLSKGVSGSIQIFDEGSGRYLENSLFPFRGEDGLVDGYVHIVRDRTEKVLRDAEMIRLYAAMEQTTTMVVIADRDGNIEYVNPTFTKNTGYSSEDIVGKNFSLFSLAEHSMSPERLREIKAAVMKGKAWSGTLRTTRKNEETYWARLTVSPIHDDNGNIISFLSTSEDISREVETHQQLVQAEKMAAVGTLAAGVAHEFKNYLGGIIGDASFALDTIEDTPDIDIAKDTLANIIDMGERANDVAMSLLTYSKTKDDEFGFEDLRSIVQHTVELVDREMRSRSVQLVTYLEEVPLVRVSPGKLQQLLLNLIINGAQAIGTDGVITVALGSDSKSVNVNVGDSGPGIPAQNLSKVFDPFFSTKGVWGKDDKKNTGTGMGLAICRNIALEHGGDLTVRSIEGLGTTFTLTLPIANEELRPALTPDSLLSRRILLFTLDKKLLSHYFADACRAGAELTAADDLDSVYDRIREIAHLVVCDGAFPGKIEMSRLVKHCDDIGIPCLVINLAGLEYQMTGMLSESAARFSRLPDFEQILEHMPVTA